MLIIIFLFVISCQCKIINDDYIQNITFSNNEHLYKDLKDFQFGNNQTSKDYDLILDFSQISKGFQKLQKLAQIYNANISNEIQQDELIQNFKRYENGLSLSNQKCSLCHKHFKDSVYQRIHINRKHLSKLRNKKQNPISEICTFINCNIHESQWNRQSSQGFQSCVLFAKNHIRIDQNLLSQFCADAVQDDYIQTSFVIELDGFLSLVIPYILGFFYLSIMVFYTSIFLIPLNGLILKNYKIQ